MDYRVDNGVLWGIMEKKMETVRMGLYRGYICQVQGLYVCHALTTLAKTRKIPALHAGAACRL